MTRSIRLAAIYGCLTLLAATLLGQTSKSTNDPAAIRDALRPLQVVVGQWRGNTFREHVVHQVDWAWDHRTDPAAPALVMEAPKNPFFESARLSFDPDAKQYLLTVIEPSGARRELVGVFTEQPRNIVGDDGRGLQRTFEIRFEQSLPKTGEQWRLVMNQQENNRFLVELEKRRGGGRFRRFDTFSNQRKGTNFAILEEGYGEKTCIISGGLGTIPVSHAGRTYYVCCSGCKAAFEEDPEAWIAAAKERAKESRGE